MGFGMALDRGGKIPRVSRPGGVLAMEDGFGAKIAGLGVRQILFASRLSDFLAEQPDFLNTLNLGFFFYAISIIIPSRIISIK